MQEVWWWSLCPTDQKRVITAPVIRNNVRIEELQMDISVDGLAAYASTESGSEYPQSQKGLFQCRNLV